MVFYIRAVRLAMSEFVEVPPKGVGAALALSSSETPWDDHNKKPLRKDGLNSTNPALFFIQILDNLSNHLGLLLNDGK